MAAEAGIEPATGRLTAECSTAELLRTAPLPLVKVDRRFN